MSLPTMYDVTTLVEEPDGRVSRNKLYELLESGELNGKKVGSKWLIPEPNVLAWLGLNMNDDTDDSLGAVVPINSAQAATEAVTHAS